MDSYSPVRTRSPALEDPYTGDRAVRFLRQISDAQADAFVKITVPVRFSDMTVKVPSAGEPGFECDR